MTPCCFLYLYQVVAQTDDSYRTLLCCGLVCHVLQLLSPGTQNLEPYKSSHPVPCFHSHVTPHLL